MDTETLALRSFRIGAPRLTVRQAAAHLESVIGVVRECGGLLAALRAEETWAYGVWPVAVLAWASGGREIAAIAVEYAGDRPWRAGGAPDIPVAFVPFVQPGCLELPL